MTRLESLKRAYKKLLMEVHSSCSKEPKQFWRYQYHRMTTKNSTRGGIEPGVARIQAVCAMVETEK